MPHYCAEDRAGMRYARFALRLAAMPPPARAPAPAEAAAAQRAFVSRVLTHAELPLLVAPALELRFVKRETGPGLPRLTIGLIGRVAGRGAGDVDRGVRAFARHIAETSRLVFGQLGYAFEFAETAAAFTEIASPFEPRDYGEVRRAERSCPQHLDAHPDVDAFGHPSGAEICRSMLGVPGSATVGVVLSRATAEPAFSAMPQHADAPAGSVPVGGDWRDATPVRAAATQTCRGWLETLADDGYLTRVHLSAPSELSSALIAAVGAEVVGPGLGARDDGDERDPQWLWRRPRNVVSGGRSEAEVALDNARLLAFEPWGLLSGDARTLLASASEAASLFALPEPGATLAPYVATTSLALPAPAVLPASGVLLGANRHGLYVNDVRLASDDRRRHTWITGQTGTGKSTLLEAMVLQDIRAGAPVILIEPHGDLIARLIARIPYDRIDDVILVDPSDAARPVCFNPLDARREEDWPFLVNSFISALYDLYDPTRSGIMGPRFEHAARNAMLTVMAARGTLVDVVRVLTDDEYARELLPAVRDPFVRAYWEREIAQTSDFHKSEVLGYFVSKFARFVSDATIRRIVGRPESTFDFRSAIDERRIVLIDLSRGRLGTDTSRVFGSLFLPHIMLAALSRIDTPEHGRHDAYLYVDEFQSLPGAALASMLAEVRKYRLSLTLANQHAGQLDDDLRDALVGNAGNLICFRAGVTDAAFLAGVLQPSDIACADIVNLPNFQAYARLLAGGVPSAPFLLETHAAAGAWSEADALRVRARSREQYGRADDEATARG